MTNCSETVYLGIGSNEGDSVYILKESIIEIGSYLHDLHASSIYSTSPQGFLNQNDFYNCVIVGTYLGSAESLLEKCQYVENAFGRIRRMKNGPRTLDIDILLYGNSVIKTNELTIPHSQLKLRKFVLVPLLDLDWTIKDPETGEPYSDALISLGNQGIYYNDLNSYSATL